MQGRGMMQGLARPGMFLGMGVLGFIITLLVVAAIGATVYLVIRKVRQDDAVFTLRRRFAAGEISEEEFKQRLAVLKQ